jgi:predicted 3-demethylubiquinone-9 3-methyltransferase (glyoxalase superfamily)
MASIKQKITPCLWFDTEAEDAAKFYTSIFDNSRIRHISRYGNAGRDVHGKEAGSVMVVEFEIEGQVFTALNGGPQFKFDEAVSFQVMCETQAEIDYFWSKLSAGGKEGPCGWLKDKFGLSCPVLSCPVLASRAFYLAADDDRCRRREGGPHHECGPENEEVRYRGTETGLRRPRLSQIM